MNADNIRVKSINHNGDEVYDRTALYQEPIYAAELKNSKLFNYWLYEHLLAWCDYKFCYDSVTNELCLLNKLGQNVLHNGLNLTLEQLIAESNMPIASYRTYPNHNHIYALPRSVPIFNRQEQLIFDLYQQFKYDTRKRNN